MIRSPSFHIFLPGLYSNGMKKSGVRPRIAIDTSYMDRRPGKGTAIFIRHSIEELLRYRDEFDITLIHREPIPEEPLYREFREVIIPRLRLPKFSGFLSELFFFLSTRERFDIYYFSYSRLYPTFWLAPAQEKVFLAMDGGPQTSGYQGSAKTPFPWWMRMFFGQIKAFYALSEFGKEGIMSAFGIPADRIDVIPCGIDERFSRTHDREAARALVKKKYGLPSSYLLDVSRFDPHKNILGLLDAYKQLLDNGVTDLPLVFVGGRHMPDYSEQVDIRISELGLQEKILIAPFIEDDDMPYVYAAASLFVFPSFYEGFGMPVVEAMACGIPVVISDIPALREVSAGIAEIADPYDSTSIATAMKTLLTDPVLWKERSEKGILAAQKYSWEESGKKLADALRRASSTRGFPESSGRILSKEA